MDFAQSTNVIPQKMVTPNFDQIPEGINQILNIQKNKVGLELAQQSLLANKAVSKAIKENTSEDGNLDVPSIISQLSKDENASINLPQLATQLLQLKGQQFTTDTAKLSNLLKYFLSLLSVACSSIHLIFIILFPLIGDV
jgi:hypothetical protein